MTYENCPVSITKPLLYQLSYASINDGIISDFMTGVNGRNETNLITTYGIAVLGKLHMLV